MPNGSTSRLPNGFTLETPTTAPTGYSFKGWSGTGINGISTAVTIKDMHSDRNYTANWEYKVEFKANGGSGSMEDQTISKSSYKSLNSNGFAAPTGKIFLYWSTTSNDATESHHYKDRQTVKDLPTETGLTSGTKVTLYAIWGDACTVTYDKGECATGTAPPALTNIAPGTLVKLSNGDELNDFIGWATTFSDNKCGGTFYGPGDDFVVNSSTTLYAVKGVNSVTFHANGGIGTMPLQMISGNTVEIPLHANAYSNAGKLFYKWNTLSNGSGTWYYDGQTIKLSSNTSLYAIWGNGIVYDPNGADSGTQPPSYVITGTGSTTASDKGTL